MRIMKNPLKNNILQYYHNFIICVIWLEGIKEVACGFTRFCYTRFCGVPLWFHKSLLGIVRFCDSFTLLPQWFHYVILRFCAGSARHYEIPQWFDTGSMSFVVL